MDADTPPGSADRRRFLTAMAGAGVAASVLGAPPAAADEPADLRRVLAAVPELLIAGAIVRDSNGVPLSAPVVWPDGTQGEYTTTQQSDQFGGAVDAYAITYGEAVTYTQPPVTRDGRGLVVTRPPINTS